MNDASGSTRTGRGPAADRMWNQLSIQQSDYIEHICHWPYPKQVDVCRDLKIHRATIQRWNGEPEFRRVLQQRNWEESQRIRVDLERRVNAMADKAAQALEESLERALTKDSAVSLRASLAIIERILGKPVERLEHTGLGGGAIEIEQVNMENFSDGELRDFISRATIEGSATRVTEPEFRANTPTPGNSTSKSTLRLIDNPYPASYAESTRQDAGVRGRQ